MPRITNAIHLWLTESLRMSLFRLWHRLLLFVFLVVLPNVAFGATKAADSPEDLKLLSWMRANVSQVTAVPFSFEIFGDKNSVYKKIGRRSSVTGIIERMIVDQGISIYDAALWQMALASTGDIKDHARAQKLVEYYWNGALGDFDDIRTGSGRQIFVYDPMNPEEVTADLSQEGRRGFIFRILNANGHYLSPDPLDGKTAYGGFPNNPKIHWEDWKPIAGENAWVVMAALHLFMNEPSSLATVSMEFKLAQELARAAMLLQAENGGIRMSPIGTYYHLQDIDPNLNDEAIAHELDARAKTVNADSPTIEKKIKVGRLEYPPYHLWYYDEISIENNISWYAALRMLYRLTNDAKYAQAMRRIEDCVKSNWDAKHHVFYQGAHFVKGEWKPNKEPFAVDVQNWAIIVFGPQTIDEWFGEGTANRMWKTTKEKAGVTNRDGGLKGLGFTTENDRVSIEWTSGAILAVRMMSDYYRQSHSDWASDLARDAKNMRAGIEEYRFNIRPGEDAYSYSSLRRWIPFGWFSHEKEVLSLASTAWVYLSDKDVNPFEL